MAEIKDVLRLGDRKELAYEYTCDWEWV